MLSSRHTAVCLPAHCSESLGWVEVVGQAARADLDLLLGGLRAGRPGRQAGRGSLSFGHPIAGLLLSILGSLFPLLALGFLLSLHSRRRPLARGWNGPARHGALPFSSSQAAVCRGHQLSDKRSTSCRLAVRG